MVLKRRALWLLALALAGWAAADGGAKPAPTCPPGTPTIDVPGTERRLKAAEALWQKRGAKAYRLRVTWLGQLSSTSSVEVRVGEPPRALRHRLTSGRPPGPGEPFTPKWETVPGLFAWVRTLLRDQTEGRPWNPHPRPCGVLDVTFDPRDGHLRSLKYDSAFSIDDEHTLTVGPVLPLR